MTWKFPFWCPRVGFHYTHFVLSLDLEKMYNFSTSNLFLPFPCLKILMIPYTVPSEINFPLLPDPAPVGSLLQALELGQEVRDVNVSSVGIYLLTFILSLFCNFASVHLGMNLLYLKWHGDTNFNLSLILDQFSNAFQYYLLRYYFSFRIVLSFLLHTS